MKIEYINKRFSEKSLEKILTAEKIIDEYAAQGYDLTLRQLFYQFVARGLIPNTVREYKNLGSVINDARLAGHIDWDSIVDRTRELQHLPHWETPGEVVRACADQFHVDLWEGQIYRPEVWIEKDALVGVIEGVCNELDVPYFSCRGYSSQSAMWAAGQRLGSCNDLDQTPVVIHLSDHDPSGIDMTRDIENRLDLFVGIRVVKVKRIALTMDQVDEWDPPPNPAKITDPRARDYISKYGAESWELDALEPKVIEDLIRKTIEQHIQEDDWQERLDVRATGREKLHIVADGM